MHRATFTIPCTNPAEALVLAGAVGVEADEGPDGTSTALSVDGAALHVEVAGPDLAGFRAAIHSVLRLLDAAKRVAN